MTIRIEFTRSLKNVKQGKGRNRVNPISISHENTVSDAINYARDVIRASEELAPGYMPTISVKLYDFDAFRAWTSMQTDTMPEPIRVLDEADIARLVA